VSPRKSRSRKLAVSLVGRLGGVWELAALSKLAEGVKHDGCRTVVGKATDL
jgi:hypothetical protein